MRSRIVLGLAMIVVSLPVGCAHSENESPRSYSYGCDFLIYGVQGEFQNRIRIEAVQTRELPGDRMRWNDAEIAFGSTAKGELGPPMQQSYMEGFSYPRPKIEDMLTGDFFASFPTNPLGFLMKNSVLDAHVFDTFIDEVEQLELNVPYRSATSDSDIKLYENEGNQKLEDLRLTWTGTSERNGQDCKVIRYQSSVDSVNVNVPGATQAGSTVFWGDLWVSTGNGGIEYATLFEHSLMGPVDTAAPIKELQSIFRSVTLERVDEVD